MTAMLANRNETRVDWIDLTSKYAVRQWTEILNISEEALIAAVQAVGNDASEVRRYVSERESVRASR